LNFKYNKIKSPIVASLLYQVSLTAISRIISLFNSIYAAKTLGSYNIGLTNLIQTSVVQTSIIYDGGLNNVGIRKIIETKALNLEVGFHILSLRLFFGLICSALWITVINIIQPQNLIIWHFGAIGIILLSLDFSFFFRAINKFNLFVSFFSLSPFIIAILYKYFLSNNTQVGLDYIIYIISNIFVIAIIFTYIIFKYGNPYKDIFNFRLFKRLFFDHKHLWISSAIGIIYPSVQIFTISFLLGLYQNGVYKASLIFIAPLELLNFLLSGTILPILTSWKQYGLDYFKKNVKKMYFFIFFITLLFYLLILLIPKSLITELIGNKFIFSIWVFKIAITGKLFVLISSPFYYAIIANRNDSYILNFSILNSIVNTLFCFILIPIFGINGAAAAMMISDIINSLMAYVYFNKIKKINNY
jgi:O-antigen/teichoic acid export membrane protein